MRRVLKSLGGCLLVTMIGCSSGGSEAVASDAGAGSEASVDAGGGCTLAASTSTVSVGPNDCALLARDASACKASREAAGLSGFWLKFSCRVTLSKVTSGGGEAVRVVADSQPDYKSVYFAAANACHEDYAPKIKNPNEIGVQSISMDVPLAPGGTGAQMQGGAVGLALNGVAIFNNQAAPGDDIFQEVDTFDRCGAHPAPNKAYHYHSEPYSISNDDARFIGVMRDGYPVYGRKDEDGSYPTLDATGGHTGVTADSPQTAVYHYHVNEQSNRRGVSAFFLTTGTYKAAPGTCTGC